MSVLVIADHDHKILNRSLSHIVSAAIQLDKEVHVLVAGSDCQSVADTAKVIEGVNKVLIADNPVYEHQLAENIAALVVEVSDQYSHILAASSTTGKNLLPRVAALVDQEQVSDIIKIVDSNTFVRPIYAGNAIATVRSSANLQLLTVRETAFEAAKSIGSAAVERLDSVHTSNQSSFIKEEIASSKRPDLGAADIVISGGRGLGSEENFGLIYKIADKLGAAVGASRAAVDAGYVPNDMQVGQTGRVIAPKLYIAVGISGAIQHLAGMKDSKIIVAINKDEEAPIFQVADYGLVADLFNVLPELEALL